MCVCACKFVCVCICVYSCERECVFVCAGKEKAVTFLLNHICIYNSIIHSKRCP